MRQISLTTVKGGINRLRTKGAARADSLYDLVNGYVTAARTIKVRPGTIREATVDSDTKGLCAFEDELHTFSSSAVADGDIPDGFVNHVLFHPTDDTASLSEIHFAEPFMGFLYVVAEFDDGNIYHYWLQSGGEWQAETVYKHGDIVEPTTPNGLAYRATRFGPAYPSWAPNVPREEGDKIEPTEYNDFFYEVVDTVGTNPSSGDTEPDWPIEDGAQINEDADGELTAPPTTTVPPDVQEPTSSVQERYGNPRFGPPR